jgi:r-opsin
MATWIYGLIWSVLQFGSQHGYVLEGFLTSCSFDYLSRDLYTRVFMSSMIIGGFFVPLIVLIIFLWLTKRALETKLNEFGENQVYVFNSKSRTKEYSRAVTTLSRTDSLLDRSYSLTRSRFGGDVSMDDNRKFSFKKRQFRVIKTILLNIIFFCVSWTPYCILVIIAQYGSNIEEYVNPYTTSIPALVAKVSSIYNPILYTLNNQECRNYFKKVFFH